MAGVNKSGSCEKHNKPCSSANTVPNIFGSNTKLKVIVMKFLKMML
jgi:hypothetical protein